VRRLLKSHTTRAFRAAVRDIVDEARIQQKHFHALGLLHKMRVQPPYKIQLGCGPSVKPGWINIDLFKKEADLHLDLREPLPFPDNSAVQIYSEHFFEHLTYPEEVNHLLAESLRVLQPDGLFGIGVPDTVWPLQSYVNRWDDYFSFSHGQGFLPKGCDTHMDVINEHFRGFPRGKWGHKYAYDLETLVKVLQQAGFIGITPRNFDPSIDSELRKIGSLYVDAHKP
jgi:predicted SAM-dependent methyltransferase